MKKKLVFIGGGSAKFVRELVVDIFSYEELRDFHISLMDINQERVQRSERIVQKIIRELGINATVESTSDQRKALEGADYVIITIMVGGLDFYKSDGEIPVKYGVCPSVGDTIGPGAVFRLIRTAPVLKEIVNNLREVAPNAWILNYANPMAMNTWTLLHCEHQKIVGLCHSVQGCYLDIAKWLNIPSNEVEYTAGGINHINFYLTLTHKGKDIYPDLRTNAERIVSQFPYELPRFELLKYLGHFPAEGPHHQTEYYPWFRKNQKMIDYYKIETMWGYKFDSEFYNIRVQEVEDQITGKKKIDYTRSVEYSARIVHSLETGKIRKFYGNVRNNGLISNLPPQAIVEVPCVVDKNGIIPCRVGEIPLQLAAVMTPHIHIHQMAVKGVLEKDRRLIYQAIQADPLTGAILTLSKIEQMVDELFVANKAFMKDWK